MGKETEDQWTFQQDRMPEDNQAISGSFSQLLGMRQGCTGFSLSQASPVADSLGSLQQGPRTGCPPSPR